MTDTAPSPPFAAFSVIAASADAALAESVARTLDMTLPEECRPGVVANVRLLARHWDTLRGGGA